MASGKVGNTNECPIIFVCVCVFHFLLGFLVSTKKQKNTVSRTCQDQCYENVVIGADTSHKDYQAFECELSVRLMCC